MNKNTEMRWTNKISQKGKTNTKFVNLTFGYVFLDCFKDTSSRSSCSPFFFFGGGRLVTWTHFCFSLECLEPPQHGFRTTSMTTELCFRWVDEVHKLLSWFMKPGVYMCQLPHVRPFLIWVAWMKCWWRFKKLTSLYSPWWHHVQKFEMAVCQSLFASSCWNNAGTVDGIVLLTVESPHRCSINLLAV